MSSEQQNTSNKNLPILTDETVTVVDPREPLYGQTFPIVFIENKQYRGPCCIVRDVNGVERHIPVAVTNRSVEPLAISPIPLSLSSVRQLLSAYERIVRLKPLRYPVQTAFLKPTPSCPSKSGRSFHPNSSRKPSKA